MKLDHAFRALPFVLAIAALPGALVREAQTLAATSATPNLERQASVPQGPVVNGISLQGPVLQGISLQGISLQGVQLAGFDLSTLTDLQRLSLRGGELVAMQKRNEFIEFIAGDQLAGTTLEGMLSDSTTLALRIDEVTPTNDIEIFEYTVSYWNGSNWANLCGEQNELPVRALALAGRWDESSGTESGGDYVDDPNSFTFACKNAVLAKCVVMGYAPWRSLTECNGETCQTIAMRDMHQACTRMMRADYCGDGTPHTQNGTTIDVWDNFAIQTPDVNLPVQWTDEAEWTPNGATAIHEVRWSGTAERYIDFRCPERWAAPEATIFPRDSSFFTAAGFNTPIADRNLLRNQFTHDAY